MENAGFGARMKQRRKELGITLGDIADKIGVAVSTVQRYETDSITKLKMPVVTAIAQTLRVDPQWLLGESDRMHALPLMPRMAEDVISFPVLTSVAAHFDGMGMDVSDEFESVEIPSSFLHGRSRDEFFAMRVRGDSMYPEYHDGDTVLVLRQSTLAHSGQVGIIAYGDEELTLKRIEYAEGEPWLRLVATNPLYPPRMITGVDLESCVIIGVPRLLIRDYM